MANDPSKNTELMKLGPKEQGIALAELKEGEEVKSVRHCQLSFFRTKEGAGLMLFFIFFVPSVLLVAHVEQITFWQVIDKNIINRPHAALLFPVLTFWIWLKYQTKHIYVITDQRLILLQVMPLFKYRKLESVELDSIQEVKAENNYMGIVEIKIEAKDKKLVFSRVDSEEALKELNKLAN